MRATRLVEGRKMMKILDNSSVELTQDEQILGNFFAYLVDERGMSLAHAEEYLCTLSTKVTSVLTRELQDWCLGTGRREGQHVRTGKHRSVQIGNNV